MLALTPRVCIISSMLMCLMALSGCNKNDSKIEIKPAPKLDNDATTYAHKAWQLINTVDPIVYSKKIELIDTEVKKPLRELNIAWRINVKMTDSVTEGKYALCRKVLTSLDTWARAVENHSSDASEAQRDYERDKAQCKDAIDHPALGNTDPK